MGILGRFFRRDEPAAPAATPLSRRRVPEGSYSFRVVGESNYQDAIRKAIGRTGPAWEGPAWLVAEPKNPYDRNAVKVEIGGRTVGYLERDLAAEFQAGVLRQEGGRYAVTACCTGGGRGKPSLGIVVQFDPRPLR